MSWEAKPARIAAAPAGGGGSPPEASVWTRTSRAAGKRRRARMSLLARYGIESAGAAEGGIGVKGGPVRDSAIFFGGLILGVLLSAVCGFDLFPDRRGSPPSRERPADRETSSPELERQLAAARVERERLVWELEKLRDEGKLRDQSSGGGDPQPTLGENPREKTPGPDPENPGAEGDQVLALRSALQSAAWPEAAELVDRLLSRGE